MDYFNEFGYDYCWRMFMMKVIYFISMRITRDVGINDSRESEGITRSFSTTNTNSQPTKLTLI